MFHTTTNHDNAGNYTSHLYSEYLEREHVRPEYSPAYSKDLNPIAERTIGVIFDRQQAGPVLGWTSAVAPMAPSSPRC